jgi:hypothetical protein
MLIDIMPIHVPLIMNTMKEAGNVKTNTSVLVISVGGAGAGLTLIHLEIIQI